MGPGPGPRAHLTDFGIARAVETGSALTRTGQALGTPHYMSPEQARGEAATLGPPTDVWSLGCVLYELLTGRPPFEGDTPAAMVAAVAADAAPPLRTLRPDTPWGLSVILAVALAPTARDRYPDAGALRDDLSRALRGERPRARRAVGARLRLVLAVGAATTLAATAWWVAPGLAGRRAAAVPAPVSDGERLAARARALRQSDPRAAADLLGQALRATPGRHDWRLEHGLLLWAAGAGGDARAEWARVPTGAPVAAAARLYRALEAMCREEGGRLRDDEAVPDLEPLAQGSGREAELARGALAAIRLDWADARARLRGVPGWEAALLLGTVEAIDPAGDPAAALRAYDTMLAEGIAFGWIYGNRATMRERAGDAAAARADLEVAARLLPRDARTHRRLGVARQQAGDFAGAVAAHDAALALEPDDAWTLSNRGAARSALGDQAGAFADLAAALRIQPDFPEALCNRGQAHHLLGDLRAAIADFDAALAVAPGLVIARLNRGNVRLALDDAAGAAADYTEVLRVDPGSADAWCNRGTARRELGDDEGAIEDYTAALARDPASRIALQSRGDVRRERGEIAEAVRDLTEAVRLAPDDPVSRLARGLLRLKQHDPAGALADFEAALRARPDYHEALTARGTARREAGDLAGAATDLRAAVAAKPDSPHAHVNLGMVLQAGSDWAEAATAYRTFLRLAPDHPHADEVRGRLADCERALAPAPGR